MVCDGCNCYFSLWAIFYTSTAQILPFYPVTAQKMKISKKWKKKKKTGDMIILHKCNKNLDHRLYCSWDMACDECNCYFSFWAIFCPFTFLIAQKMKISKKMKKRPGDIIISHMCTKNHDHMLYCSWDMAHDTCNFDFSFWAIFCPFTHAPHLPPPPPNIPKNQNFRKWKKDLEISSFYTSEPNIMIRWCMVPEIRCTTGGWTDGWTEKVTYRSGCPT